MIMPIEDYPIYKNVSIADFKEKFNAIERLDDKLDFIYSYLLCHGMGEEAPSCSFEDLLHVAKQEFIKSSIALKDEFVTKYGGERPGPNVINPYSHDVENEAKQTVFLADPLRFMQAMGASIAATPINDPNLTAEEQAQVNQWKDNAGRISEQAENLRIVFNNLEQDSAPSEITENVGKRLFQREGVSVNEFIEHNMGGTWENFFGTTSREYKNFKAAFERFNLVDDPKFGDRDTLRNTAMAYVRHKFPNLEEGKLPTAEQIAAVKNATSKGRIEFAVAVLQELKERERIDEMDNTFKSIDLDNPNPQQDNNLQQQEFQEQIANDIAEEYGQVNVEEVNVDVPVVDNKIDIQ